MATVQSASFWQFLTAALSMERKPLYHFYLLELHSHLLGSSHIQESHLPGEEQNKFWFLKRPPSCKIFSMSSWRKQNRKVRTDNYVYRGKKINTFSSQTGLLRIKCKPLSEAWSGSRQIPVVPDRDKLSFQCIIICICICICICCTITWVAQIMCLRDTKSVCLAHLTEQYKR